MTEPRDNLFERARGHMSVEDYVAKAGKALKRSGSAELRGACILCESGTSKFTVKAGLWKCWGCSDQHWSDVTELVAQHRRMAPLEAARWLLGEDGPTAAERAARTPAKAKPEGPSRSALTAAEIWAGARPLAGTMAERYLLGRGIAPEIVAVAADNLRFNGLAPHHWDDQTMAWVRCPAMVAQVVVAGPAGEPVPTGGVHVTYLDRRTAGKAQLDPAKKMWGPQSLDGKPGGAWLIGPLAPERPPYTDWDLLAVAEGIETALSMATLALRRGRRIRACAALSLNRLQGGIKPDKDGCIDLDAPVPDPERPAFVWRQVPGAAWEHVVVCVDADMSEVRARARTGRGKPVDVQLTAPIRARLCGKLAVAAWKAAGALSAQAISPPAGRDFNDELLASGSGPPSAARTSERAKIEGLA